MRAGVFNSTYTRADGTTFDIDYDLLSVWMVTAVDFSEDENVITAAEAILENDHVFLTWLSDVIYDHQCDNDLEDFD